MKKLPKIYQAESTKKISNNKKHCYIKNITDITENKITENYSVAEKLEQIFSGLGYSYNIPLIITTKNKKYNTSLIAKTKNNVITLENEIIPISDIVDIKEKKNN